MYCTRAGSPTRQDGQFVRHAKKADAGKLFAGRVSTKADTRYAYGEDRLMTAGYVAGRCVVIVWTPRGRGRRIISMMYTHADEERRWFP